MKYSGYNILKGCTAKQGFSPKFGTIDRENAKVIEDDILNSKNTVIEENNENLDVIDNVAIITQYEEVIKL